ncbi:hypothetical protein [Myceligenerans xiligouense]|uniref:PGAP1-like protein n=1 Tax=Myceligenerans xiligouense TaxID=253184 RepID=A0A3N4YJK8_9MICO|nr:hypothetical protein [Myceligenerans xiligouense]RPF19586.1 hypothetical protein EDD34_0137 [Myceligenerans xiligouense]
MSSSRMPVVAGPDMPRDPADTLVVTGGTGVASIDAAQVRVAAARIAGAVGSLRRAAGLSGAAWAEVAGGATASGMAGLRAGVAAERRVACRTIEAVTSGLLEHADALDVLEWRLLRAAGLYEEAEGMIERLVGGLVTAEGFVIGTAVGVAPVVRLLGGAYRATGGAATGGAATGGAATGGAATGGAGTGGAGTGSAEQSGEQAGGAGRTSRGVPEGAHGERTDEHGEGAGRGWTAGGFGGGVVRGIAPWTDELAYGFGYGLARSAGARPGVPGAAGTLADAVRDAPGGDLGHGIRLERVKPEGFAGTPPAWRDRGAGTLDEALSRVDDLYPRRGAPEATIAVQRVAGPGDVTSWMVLVPGTQSVPPADHPWDGLTDLELVAGRPDQATQAVEAAMSDAGIRPDEPVILVGHSLGGIAVTALASRSTFAERYRIGGVVTAGAPVATFTTPPGVPVLHLETAEEVVSSVDGRSSAENPRAPDRVTVGRSLAESSAEVDRAAAGDLSGAHSIRTHARTLALARESGDVRVSAVVGRIEPLLPAERAETTFYRSERATAGVSPGASTGPEGSP